MKPESSYIRLRGGVLKSLRIRRNNQGQIFPFLIVIIIILLVLAMAFINTSQVNLRQVATMNAADAGAMAGAAAMATTANAIADINVNQMMPQFAVDEGALAAPLLLEPAEVIAKFTAYYSMIEKDILTYYGTMITGYKGVQQAGGSAFSQAFRNMPIEEPTYRVGSSKGPAIPNFFSGLSQYLERTEIYNTDTKLDVEPYFWSQYSFNITTGKQQVDFGLPLIVPPNIPEAIGKLKYEMADVDVKKPEKNALEVTPMPSLPIFANWHMILWGGPTCPASIAWASSGITTMYTMQYVNTFALAAFMVQTPLYSFMEGHNVAGVTTTIPTLASLLVSSICWFYMITCLILPPTPGYAASGCVLWYPVPFLIGLEDGNSQIEVTAERSSPPKDLGLFGYERHDIKSRSKAGMTGGSVFQPGSYDIEMIEVH